MRDERLSEVDDALARVTSGPRPRGAGIRIALDTLRVRLHVIHERCASIDAKRWSEYRAALDAGLDELDSELTRVTEHPDPEDLDELLYPHLTRLELDAWRVRATHIAGTSEPDSVSLDLIAYAHRQLDSQHSGTGLPRGDLERIMDAIRDSIPHAGTGHGPR